MKKLKVKGFADLVREAIDPDEMKIQGAEGADDNLDAMEDTGEVEEVGDQEVEEIKLEIYGDFNYSDLEKFIQFYDEGVSLQGAELTLKLSGRVDNEDEFIQKLEDEFQVREI